MVITSTEGQVMITISDAKKADFGRVDTIYVIETPEVFQRL